MEYLVKYADQCAQKSAVGTDIRAQVWCGAD